MSDAENHAAARASGPTDSDPAAEIAALKEELGAARRTIDVLVRRVEGTAFGQSTERVAIVKAVSALEDVVRHRTDLLRESETHYRALYEACPDALLTLEAPGVVAQCNPAAEVIFGDKASRLRGLTLDRLLTVDSAASLTGLLWSGFQGSGDSTLELRNGRLAAFSAASLGPGETLLVLRDVTQRDEISKELLRARRMASIGRLAAAVAHQVNNPLAVIQGRLQLLSSLPDQNPALVAKQIDIMLDHCRRIGGIVQNLQAFALPASTQRERVPARKAIDRAVASAGRLLERVKVEVSTTSSRMAFWADPGQLNQILVNLLCHGAECSPTGGRVRLEARREQAGQVTLALRHDGEPLAPEVIQQLSDVRRGSQLLDPAHTLRLSIIQLLALEHGGGISVEGGATDGAVLLVRLPAEPRGKVPVPRRARDVVRVLVVDDQHLLCETVTWMLGEEGFQVSTAHTAEAALGLLARDRFDVVLADQILPGMNGDELMRTIAERWPELGSRVVLTSGIVDEVPGAPPLLRKPFTRTQLLDAIESKLEV